MAELREGSIINSRFEVADCVGTGGFASVWRGTDNQLKREVAIKRLLFKGTPDPTHSKEAIEEARKIASVSHPNVVSVYDVIRYDDEILIIMEFLHGGSLHDLLRDLSKSGKWVHPIQSFDFMEGILSGLQAAHDAENGPIIHKDLKPHNILFDRKKQAKIADFGIASVGVVSPIETVHPGKWEHEGTPGYKSPEQLRGDRLDPRSDLFNAGLIAYLLFAEFHPFIDPRFLFEYKEMVFDVYRSRPTLVSDNLPNEMEEFLGSLLALEPNERFSTAAEALAEIAHMRAKYDKMLLDITLSLHDYLRGARSDDIRLLPIELARGISLCKQNGFYVQGAFLYEKSGLDFTGLTPEVTTVLESDYHFCRRRAGREVSLDES